jgi:hypothetical protein
MNGGAGAVPLLGSRPESPNPCFASAMLGGQGLNRQRARQARLDRDCQLEIDQNSAQIHEKLKLETTFWGNECGREPPLGNVWGSKTIK